MGVCDTDDASDYASLDFGELQEALARCAVNMFEKAMRQWLPSHDRYVFSMAEAVRAFLRVLLWEASVEQVMWEGTLIGATWHALLTLLPLVARGMPSSPYFPW